MRGGGTRELREVGGRGEGELDLREGDGGGRDRGERRRWRRRGDGGRRGAMGGGDRWDLGRVWVGGCGWGFLFHFLFFSVHKWMDVVWRDG